MRTEFVLYQSLISHGNHTESTPGVQPNYRGLSPSNRKLTSCYLNTEKWWLPIAKGFWCCTLWAESGSSFSMVASFTFIVFISNVLVDCFYEGLASFRNNNKKSFLLIYIAF